MLTQLANLAAD